jgi:hypothetical protein
MVSYFSNDRQACGTACREVELRDEPPKSGIFHSLTEAEGLLKRQ